MKHNIHQFNYQHKMKQTVKLAVALLLAMSSSSVWAQWGAPVDPNPNMGMKDAYKDYFMIGVAVNQRNVSDADQINLINKSSAALQPRTI